MFRVPFFVLVFFVSLSSEQVLADVDCQAGENLVTGYFGVSPVVRDIPPMLGYPGAEEAKLVRVQLAWLAAEGKSGRESQDKGKSGHPLSSFSAQKTFLSDTI